MTVEGDDKTSRQFGPEMAAEVVSETALRARQPEAKRQSWKPASADFHGDGIAYAHTAIRQELHCSQPILDLRLNLLVEIAESPRSDLQEVVQTLAGRQAGKNILDNSLGTPVHQLLPFWFSSRRGLDSKGAYCKPGGFRPSQSRSLCATFCFPFKLEKPSPAVGSFGCSGTASQRFLPENSRSIHKSLTDRLQSRCKVAPRPLKLFPPGAYVR